MPARCSWRAGRGWPWPPRSARSPGRCRSPWVSARWCCRCRGGRTGAGARGSALTGPSQRGRTSRVRSAWPAQRSCPPRWTCGDGGHGSAWHAARPSPMSWPGFPRSSPGSAPSVVRSASTRPPMTWPTASNCGYSTVTRTPTRSRGRDRRSRSITEPAELGPFEDAMPCRVLFLRRHAIFGGSTGSGKSGGLNVLMGNLTACPDVVIWAIDLKRGMELGPWTECIDRLATTPEQATALLRDAVAILKGRAEYLASIGRRTWEPTPEMPALVIVIDEYAELAEEAPEAMHDTDTIARLGRAHSRNAHSRNPAADSESDGTGRGPLANGPTDMLPRPRAARRGPGPRPGNAQSGMECPQAERARESSSSPRPSMTFPAVHAPTS